MSSYSVDNTFTDCWWTGQEVGDNVEWWARSTCTIYERICIKISASNVVWGEDEGWQGSFRV